MSLDQRILAAVEGGAANELELGAAIPDAKERTIALRLGYLVSNGKVTKDDDGVLTMGGTPKVRAPRSKPEAVPITEAAAILFAADEDGDLQLSRRDGEGEILTIPGGEIARLVEFVRRNFREALRG